MTSTRVPYVGMSITVVWSEVVKGEVFIGSFVCGVNIVEHIDTSCRKFDIR